MVLKDQNKGKTICIVINSVTPYRLLNQKINNHLGIAHIHRATCPLLLDEGCRLGLYWGGPSCGLQQSERGNLLFYLLSDGIVEVLSQLQSSLWSR